MVEDSGARIKTLFYFTHYHNVAAVRDLPDLKVSLIRTHEVSSFPIAANFAVEPFGGELMLNLCIAVGAAESAAAANLSDAYAQALVALAKSPLTPLDAVKLFSHSTSGTASGSKLASIDRRLVNCRFEQACEAAPDALAVGWRDERLSYCELAAAAEGVGVLIKSCGVGTADRVALVLSRGPPLIAAMLACLSHGICFIPLDPLTPS